KMKMRAGCQTGLANETYLLVLLYALAFMRTDFAQMPISALIPVIVLDTHVVTQLVVPTGRGNRAVGNTLDRRSLCSGIVHPFVVTPATQNGMNTRPESGADSQLTTSEG